MIAPPPDIVADIKARAQLDAYDLARAEDRAAFDNWLRAELSKISDGNIRAHAAEILRDWRREVFGQLSAGDVGSIIARIEAIEAFLGLQPRPQSWPEEITQPLRRKG